MAMLLVVDVLTIVRIALRVAILTCLLLLPFSMAVLQSVPELTGVTAAIYPLVLAETLRFTLNVLSDKDVAVGKEVTSISLPQAAVPLSFVFVTVTPDVDAIALRFRVLPLTYV